MQVSSRFAAVLRPVCVTVIAVTSTPALATQLPIKPGKYEVTVTMRVGSNENASTRTRCVIATDLDDPELVFTQDESARKLARTWKLTGLSLGNERIAYTVTPDGLPAAAVKGTVSATAFDVERRVTGFNGATRIVGRRVGDCKK